MTFQRAIDRETDIRVFSILSLLENLSSPLPVTIGDIKAEGSILDRQKTLKHMRNKTRLAREEQGINILYLSFGFIEWRDGKGASANTIRSPLILVPVTLVLDSLNSPYTITKHEDDIVLNPTLVYYFKTEYGIDLPSYDADKLSLDDYLKELEIIADQRGWRIIREASLGLLSFLKITMYNDLLQNEDRIKSNPVIRALAGDSDEANDIPDELHTFELDSISTSDCYQVMSADSSQQDAILYSRNNISYVMQGPPGTGKSQTITNIIAEALADGKKVLFVSEKMAALQVVYRRLQDAHLGDFCLPLHSYKANKKEILEQIGANLKLKQPKVKDSAINNLEELLAIRNELNDYAAELHELNPQLNLSCYEVYSKLEKVSDAPSVIFNFNDPLEVTQAGLQSYLNALKEYSQSVERLNFLVKNNPWEGLNSRVTGYEYTEQMRTELSALNDGLAVLTEVMDGISECADLSAVLEYPSLAVLAADLKKLSELPEMPDSWVDPNKVSRYLHEAREAKSLCVRRHLLKNEIGKVFNVDIYRYDYNGWKETILTAADNFSNMPLIVDRTPDYFVSNVTELISVFKGLKEKLCTAQKASADISSALGFDITLNAGDQKILTDVFSVMKENVFLSPKWFAADISKIRHQVNEAKKNAAELRLYKQQLLSEWEPEILSLAYASMLQRYKTDYTGIFKVFRSQYHRDKKQLRGLSRNIIKDISDDAAVSLLKKLKAYHDVEKWFDDNKTALSEICYMYYDGVSSDWDAVLTGLNNVEKLNGIFKDGVPELLRDIMSADHKTKTEALSHMCAVVSDSLKCIAESSDNAHISLNMNSLGLDYHDTIVLFDKYISELEIISEKKNTLAPYLNNVDEPIDKIYAIIEKLNDYEKVSNEMYSRATKYEEIFGRFYAGEDTDWDTIVALFDKVTELQESVLYDVLRPLFSVSEFRKHELSAIATQIVDIFERCNVHYNWVNEQFSADGCQGVTSFAMLARRTVERLENIDMLDKWIDFVEAKDKCKECGLADLVDKLEAQDIYKDIDKVFLKGFYRAWLGAVYVRSASLRRFRRNAHDERIKKFVELDDLQLIIAQMRIREKLIEKLPSVNRLLKATDELAILNKELGKKRNIMPLRKLFRQIPNLLMKLKPCLMMSPLSVSYFLEAQAYHFDLVIFDEASQIFPEDAIGAIFRGSQVIIVGDSKQLPPTNFFAASTNNFDGDYDANSEDEYDQSEIVSDSILEEAAAVLPNRMLRWHYRSKHEDLIAFSNREIYKNELITFPNSVNNVPDMGIEYIYVENGYYEGSGKNCNIREAQKCVMLVLEHIHKHPDRSLGIIAFSEKQQAAIENAIIDFRERMPEYEWFFDESKDEPFFVKNLENVQGDERDTIIFSICYAKDRNGRMYMRFGPLGNAGGERRLNVAITRAKCNIKLVGSILPSDIDLSRTNSEGVRMLRSYIEFARNSSVSLRNSADASQYDTVDEFCNVVAAFLESEGYKIRRQVGCSDYKIDIAIENPEVEGDYIAGIECDGNSYIQARTARDRDHLRGSVLKNMGWNLYRVWSAEWCRDSIAEKQALLDFIRSVSENEGGSVHSINNSNDVQDICIDEIAGEMEKSDDVSERNPYGFSYYEEANWWDGVTTSDRSNLSRISSIILHIVSVEEPIHLELLYKRMGPSFTTGKATVSVKITIDDAIESQLKRKVVIDDEHFVRLLPLNAIKVRVPKEWSTPRPMEFISREEVACALVCIIENSFGITEADLATECARVFGFERKGAKIKAKTDSAIRYLLDHKAISIIDGKVQLTGVRI